MSVIIGIDYEDFVVAETKGFNAAWFIVVGVSETPLVSLGVWRYFGNAYERCRSPLEDELCDFVAGVDGDRR